MFQRADLATAWQPVARSVCAAEMAFLGFLQNTIVFLPQVSTLHSLTEIHLHSYTEIGANDRNQAIAQVFDYKQVTYKSLQYKNLAQHGSSKPLGSTNLRSGMGEGALPTIQVL
jgi:hypothetical protein